MLRSSMEMKKENYSITKITQLAQEEEPNVLMSLVVNVVNGRNLGRQKSTVYKKLEKNTNSKREWLNKGESGNEVEQ